VLDQETGKEVEGNDVRGLLVVKSTWPGILRTVYGDHDRFLSGYLKVGKA
jgi:acetyl-CoA synthetase